MKKILLIAGIGTCLASTAIVAMLTMANRVGDSVQRDFFALVATNDPEAFLDAADPRMRSEVDPPLLRQWMQAVNETLGPYIGLEPTDFHSSTRFEAGNRIVETTGTVRFEKGIAKSQLTYVNGRLARFDVTSEQLDDNWLGVPHDTTMYRAQAESFYYEFAQRNPDAAYEFLSDVLKQEVKSVGDFRNIVDRIGAGLGQLQAVEFVDEDFVNSDEEGQQLLLRFRIVGSKGSYDAEAVFVFQGLKAQFNEFNVTPAAEF